MTPDQIADAIREAEKTAKLIKTAEALGLTLGYTHATPDRPRFVNKVLGLSPPACFIVADIGEHDQSFGPAGFDMGSLCVLRTAAEKVLINSTGAEAQWYAVALMAAFSTDCIAVIVETTERHAADWLNFFGDGDGRRTVLNVISAEGGHA